MMGRIQNFDNRLITFLKNIEIPAVRIAIFTVYFWFGVLKLIGVSPATPLVHALFDRTIHFVSFDVFYTWFAVFEIIIGVLFLIPKTERLAILLLGLHLFTTALPLVLLPGIAWQGWFIPTLEGQYIIKNVLIIASAIVIGARVVPIYSQRRK